MRVQENVYLGIYELSSIVKCKKCNKRGATGEDELCDNCRFVLILDNMTEERAIETARERTKRYHTH